MKSLNKTIFYIIYLGISINALKTYFEQRDLEFVLVDQIFLWYFRFGFYGYILISVAALLSFITYRKQFPGYVSFCYVGLILLVCLASWNDFGDIMKNPSFLYSSKGIGAFVNIGILFFAADKEYFPKILKLFYYLCFVFIIAGLVNLRKIGFGSDRLQYLYAIREFTVYLIWVFPFFLLQEGDNKYLNKINLAAFFLIFVFVLSTGSRSYLIIYALYFIIKFKNYFKQKNVIVSLASMSLLLLFGFFVLSNSGFGKTIEGAFNILSERTVEDSRSNQIIEFISQFNLDYFFSGVGPLKTWFWSAVGPYAFLDNQFLLIGWWAGVPCAAIYAFFLIKSFFFKTEVIVRDNIKGTQLIVGLWILACLGFAIYVSVSTDLYYYFISLIIGLHVCRFSNSAVDDNEEI